MYSICFTGIHKSQISVCFTAQPAIFKIQAILRQMYRMTPKWPWTLQGQMYPICVTSVPKSQISVLSLYGSHFRVTGHFEKSVLNDPKMTLNTTRLNVWHICVTSIHESHILLSYALWSVIFDIQAFVRKVNRMTPKWHWTLQVQIYHIYVSLESTNPKFHSVSLYDQSLFRYRPFWNKCTAWPQNDLEPYKVKCTP